MKKIILTAAFVAITAIAWADGKGSQPSGSGFVSNGFWDNWELSIGAGVNTAITNGRDLGSRSERLGFTGQVGATKWIHPVIGLRLEFQGGRFTTFDPTWDKQKWPYLFLHTDVMLDLSNWIGGYREDRVYSAIPYFGFGYMATNFTDAAVRDNHSRSNQNFAFAYGLLNKFRLSPAFDFDFEIKGLLAPSSISPSTMDGGYLLGFSATVGFTYRFNKRGWQRVVAGYTSEDIRAFQDAVARGQASLDDAKIQNARLSEERDAARADAVAAKSAAADTEQKAAARVAEAQKTQAGPVSWVILYGLDEWELSPREKTRLDLVIQRMKSGPKDKVYTIEGHADSQTGSAEANQRISERRAKNVYDYLVSKGVNPEQLKYEGLGGARNPYNFAKANRLVLIK